MKRREFLAMTGAVAGAAAVLPGAARAGDGVGVPYDPAALEAALDAGRTVFLDFYTTWCGTCDRQERVIESLQSENPAYDEHILFVAVDWDQHSRSDLARRLRIPRRSTLVVLKGRIELGRLVADTRPDRIKRLMDTALSAAT